MPAIRTIALATVLGFLTVGGAGACSSVFNRLEDGVVRDEPITAVKISGGSGDVTVAPDPTVKGIDIRRTVRYLGHAPSIEETVQIAGGVLSLKTSCGNQCSVSYRVRTAAAGVAVTGDNGSGDINLTGVSDVDIEVGSGNVTIKDATGTVRAKTGSGDIEASNVAGRATFGTGSGNVTGSDLRGPVTSIEVSSGDVRLDLPGTGDLTAVTGSGNIDISVPDGSCRITARSSSGDEAIEVATDANSPHLLDLRTGSGDIRVRPAGVARPSQTASAVPSTGSPRSPSPSAGR